MAAINRRKVVLVEKKKSNKWLADQIGKGQGSVSKWCTNTTQPTLATLSEIAKNSGSGYKGIAHSHRYAEGDDVDYLSF